MATRSGYPRYAPYQGLPESGSYLEVQRTPPNTPQMRGYWWAAQDCHPKALPNYHGADRPLASSYRADIAFGYLILVPAAPDVARHLQQEMEKMAQTVRDAREVGAYLQGLEARGYPYFLVVLRGDTSLPPDVSTVLRRPIRTGGTRRGRKHKLRLPQRPWGEEETPLW